jgi:hypothetical protein
VPRPPEDVRRRLDELITRCDRFLPPRPRVDGGHIIDPVRFSAPRSEIWRFLISSIQTVRSACGQDSPHLRELERCREHFVSKADPSLDLDSCRGALEAARDDLAAGMLDDLRQLVAAETFGDLLEAAVHLLEESHHLPAVAIAGAVLESSLRALAAAKQVAWSGHSAISKINTELYKANVYDKVVFAEVEAWGRLRNKVDHGDFATPNEVDQGRAQRMVEGIRDFVLRYR